VVSSVAPIRKPYLPFPGKTDLFQLVELDLGEKDVIGDVVGAAETAAGLVVGEDRLEARSVSVEEQFLTSAVKIPAPLCRISQQRSCERVNRAAAFRISKIIVDI